MIEALATSSYLRTIFLVMLFFAVSSLGFVLMRIFVDRRQILGRLHSAAGPKRDMSVAHETLTSEGKAGAWAQLAERIERGGISLGDSNAKALERKMLAAGYRSPHAGKIYTLVRLLLIFVLPCAIVLPQLFSSDGISPFKLYLEGTGLAAVGLYIPSLFLTARADRRREQVVHGFPDALDLMLVCVEAGMGLEAALDRVGREIMLSHPLVAEILLQTTLELRAGASREEALRNMASRTQVDEIRAFATLLIQSDKLGSSIATTLRIYASEMREKRRMAAEEKAHRLPVLISIPLVACMLPVMIGVLMLPAAIRVIRDVAPALAGGG